METATQIDVTALRYVRVQFGDERATVYAEGGISFDVRIKGQGWFIYGDSEKPSKVIVALALAVRKEAYPDLPEQTLEELEWVYA